MTFWVVKGVKVKCLVGIVYCLSEERRVQSEKFDTLLMWHLDFSLNLYPQD